MWAPLPWISIVGSFIKAQESSPVPVRTSFVLSIVVQQHPIPSLQRLVLVFMGFECVDILK